MPLNDMTLNIIIYTKCKAKLIYLFWNSTLPVDWTLLLTEGSSKSSYYIRFSYDVQTDQTLSNYYTFCKVFIFTSLPFASAFNIAATSGLLFLLYILIFSTIAKEGSVIPDVASRHQSLSHGYDRVSLSFLEIAASTTRKVGSLLEVLFLV